MNFRAITFTSLRGAPQGDVAISNLKTRLLPSYLAFARKQEVAMTMSDVLEISTDFLLKSAESRNGIGPEVYREDRKPLA